MTPKGEKKWKIKQCPRRRGSAKKPLLVFTFS